MLATALPLNIYGTLVVLHLLAACVWLGGHVLLASVLKQGVLDGRNPDTIYRIESLYDRVGVPALVVQLFTGLFLAYLHVPDVGQWLAFDGPMGRLIGLKLFLQALALGIALDLRVRRFARVGSSGLSSLRWHVALIVLFSAASVFVGASFRIGWLY